MQITIQKLWPSSDKYVSFKGMDGRDYKGDLSLNGRLFEGQTFDVTCKASPWTNTKGEAKVTYWLPKGWTPPQDDTVGAIIPQPNGHVANNGAALVAAGRGGGYVDKDVLITTVALMKSFIETGQQPPEDLTALEELCLASAKRLVKAAS